MESTTDTSVGMAEVDARGPACTMSVCNFHGPRAPRLWVAEHEDGAGHRMQNIVTGMALARKVGMNFGGVLAEQPITDQHIDFRELATTFFGARNPDTDGLFAWYKMAPPNFSASFEEPRELEGQRGGIRDGTNVWLPGAHEWDWNRTAPSSLFFPCEFRKMLASPLAAWPLVFAPERPIVAIHLRRGDLPRDDARATPNEYYYRIAEEIQAQLPSADFHVWAALRNIPWKYHEYWSSEDFDGFRTRGMQVHLDEGLEDGDRVISAWAHLARAHIFISSQSMFSYIPAVLNSRCVIYPGNIDMPLENWVNGRDEERDSYAAELKECIHRSQDPPPC